MPLMPVMLFPMWLLGLLSLALLGGGGYLFWQWYTGAVSSLWYLVGSVGLLAVALVGRPLMLLLLGRDGEDGPHAMRTGEVRRVERPDGTALHVELYGPPSGQPLVMTHGWGTDGTEWYYTKRALANRFRLIVWDLPGLGLSQPRADGDYSIEKLADDLAAVVALAGERPAILVGHSIGGMISQTFCRRLGAGLAARVAGLVLVHTTYTNPVRTTTLGGLWRVLQRPVLTPMLYLMIALSPLFWLMNWLSYYNGTLHLSTALSGFATPTRRQLDFASRFSARAWPAVVARGMLGTFQFDETATLPTLAVPTLVIAGSHDPVLLPSASRAIHQAMPNAQYVELQPGKHMGLMERHEQFNQVVAAFASARAEPLPQAA